MRLLWSVLLLLLPFALAAQDKTWPTVEIAGSCSFQLPPTLEIQKGLVKELTDQLTRTIYKAARPSDRIVAQPKGINDLDPAALKLYSRLIVETDIQTPGTFAMLDDRLEVTAAELRELDAAIKQEVTEAAGRSTASGIKMVILSWQGSSVVRIGNAQAIATTYTRSVNNNPSVLVRIAKVQNNDAVHTVTVSYRESENALWNVVLNRAVDTFKFIKR